MTQFVLRRLAQAIPILFLVATLVFSLIHLIPGDPAELMLGDGARAADVAALSARLGLDRPLAEQYGRYLAGILRGDLGTSIHFGRPVAALLAERLPATLTLAVAAMAIAFGLALPLGVWAATSRRALADPLSRLFSMVGVSIPSFWLGPMLILLFSIALGLLPVSGRAGWSSLVLPAVTLGLGQAAVLTRLVKAALAAELDRPYLRTAEAKGLSRLAAVLRHGLKNALIPVVTVAALQFGALLTGSILTETIFAWPGIGRLLIQAIHLRDYPLVQGAIVLIAATYLAANLATDLVYGVLDPRVRLR